MILKQLAEEYQQLYLKPERGRSQSEEYLKIIKKGSEAEIKSLEHFIGSSGDRFYKEKTPAGEISILQLGNRKDFDTFLQIMLYRCEPEEVPKNTGAMTLNGIVNWRKIHQHKEEFLKDNPAFLWKEEFRLFTGKSDNYKDTLILLSVGPYSSLSFEKAGYSEEIWEKKSEIIRKYHECTHVICRRKYPDFRDAVFDEILADAVGLLAAFGEYNLELASKFLGVSRNGYAQGRLRNYLSEEDLCTQNLNLTATLTFQKMCRLKDEIDNLNWESPYDVIEPLLQLHPALEGNLK